MTGRKWLRTLLLSAGGLLIVIQFVPYGRDHANLPVIAEPTWNSPETRATFFRVCANCHSFETKWPWYSHVAPASWLVQWDVDRGRADFNVSRWGTDENEGDHAAKMVRTDSMPPKYYRWAHPESHLSKEERHLFESGLAATFGESTKHHHHGDDVGEKSGYLD